MKTLQVTEAEAQIIWNSLMEQPAKAVYPVLKTLEKQLFPVLVEPPVEG